MRILKPFLLAALSSGLVACTEVAGPEVDETYVLRSVAGDALPALFRDGDFATLNIIADTLFLVSDGTGYEVQLFEMVSKADGSSHTYTSVSNLDYAVADGNIEISYECPDLASCIEPPHLTGAVTITGIVFDFALGRVPLQFERLDND